MSARDQLAAYIGYEPDERDEKFIALLDAYRAEVLREAADKLALALVPEQPGAGAGFLLALRLAMRSLRRMADEATS